VGLNYGILSHSEISLLLRARDKQQNMSELVAPSPSSSSRALVLPEPIQVQQRSKPKETVLEEDTYIDALSTIIRRDFYPDLPKLEAQLEWMDAERVNDVDKMRELQQRMLSSRRPTTGRGMDYNKLVHSFKLTLI
jgi:hypothetical protein